MEDIESVRKKIARLIDKKGLNYAYVSRAIGKNIAYIQQFIKNGSPRRLGEIERRKLAQILEVDEQELTDLPLKNSSNSPEPLNAEVLKIVIESIENWLLLRNITLSAADKAELIKLLYLKVCTDNTDTAAIRVKDFIEVYEELRKAN